MNLRAAGLWHFPGGLLQIQQTFFGELLVVEVETKQDFPGKVEGVGGGPPSGAGGEGWRFPGLRCCSPRRSHLEYFDQPVKTNKTMAGLFWPAVGEGLSQQGCPALSCLSPSVSNITLIFPVFLSAAS